jgi:hypothetical protein
VLRQGWPRRWQGRPNDRLWRYGYRPNRGKSVLSSLDWNPCGADGLDGGDQFLRRGPRAPGRHHGTPAFVRTEEIGFRWSFLSNPSRWLGSRSPGESRRLTLTARGGRSGVESPRHGDARWMKLGWPRHGRALAMAGVAPVALWHVRFHAVELSVARRPTFGVCVDAWHVQW